MKEAVGNMNRLLRNLVRIETETSEQVDARLAAEQEGIGQRREEAIKRHDIEEIVQTSTDYLDVDWKRTYGVPLERTMIVFDSAKIPLPPVESKTRDN